MEAENARLAKERDEYQSRLDESTRYYGPKVEELTAACASLRAKNEELVKERAEDIRLRDLRHRALLLAESPRPVEGADR